jgi:hypothetical protein
MISQFVLLAWRELCSYFSRKHDIQPTFEWTVFTIFALLRQYPAGISRCVLLTELESQWRSCLKEGKHGSKLKQVLSKMQISTSDIISGDVKMIDNDNFLCSISSEGATAIMIMHGQAHDFLHFLQSYNIDAYDCEQCLFIGCSLLKRKPPILLVSWYVQVLLFSIF